jgi:uncharacterized heparinase superfamily protein
MQRILINCGAPAARHENLRRAARLTAAHSTAALADSSSCRFSGPAANAQIVSGPRSVTAHRHATGDGSTVLQLSHDGYARRFGMVHERSLRLAADGRTLEGVDRFIGEPEREGLSFTVRFHLHHSVVPQATDRRTGLDLRLPDGTVWRFEANCPVELDESVSLSDVFGSRATHQLLLASRAESEVPVKWRLSLRT